MGSSLYDRIGADLLAVAVARLYERVSTDDVLKRFFADLDLRHQVRKQINFMTVAFGDTDFDVEQQLRAAHQRPVSAGLNDAHFALFVEHLEQALGETGIEPELVAEALDRVRAMRPYVLGRGRSGVPPST